MSNENPPELVAVVGVLVMNESSRRFLNYLWGIEVTALDDAERKFIPGLHSGECVTVMPAGKRCAYCGGASTRRNLRGGLECSGCGALAGALTHPTTGAK